MKQGWALTSLDYKDKKIVMGFDAPRWTADAKLRCGDPRFAVHQAAAGQRSRWSEARRRKAEMHPGARLRGKCQDHERHHLARVAESPTLVFPRLRMARSIPISASRICGRRAAFSRARRASSPIIWGPNLDLATLNPRSTPSGPIFPRCRKKWPTASIPMRSRPGSGACILHAWQLCQRQNGTIHHTA